MFKIWWILLDFFSRDEQGKGRFNGFSFKKLLFPGGVSLFERYNLVLLLKHVLTSTDESEIYVDWLIDWWNADEIICPWVTVKCWFFYWIF